jgi:hypothetical protein
MTYSDTIFVINLKNIALSVIFLPFSPLSLSLKNIILCPSVTLHGLIWRFSTRGLVSWPYIASLAATVSAKLPGSTHDS